MSLLDRLSGPDDIKRFSVRELYRLAADIRTLIISTVTANGGHLASNLGVVELTIAIHRVFSTPKDQIVWDVGHQCYTHKILTGRKAEFLAIRRQGGPSGFPKRSESIHDAFDAGHASTSVSAALGLLAAKRAMHEAGSVIAVIGDGALTGGMVYEAMSHAGQLGYPLIVVLNDNSMSISANVGAVSRHLSRLSATVRYQNFRRIVDKAILMVPFIGSRVHPYVLRAKRSVKALIFKESLFSDLGFEYAGPIDGHNIALLCNVLAEARDIRRPVVIHVVTKKGKGHQPSEVDPSTWHGVAQPMSVHRSPADGEAGHAPIRKGQTFTQVFGEAMLSLAEEDPRIVAVTAAMAKGTGLAGLSGQVSRQVLRCRHCRGTRGDHGCGHGCRRAKAGGGHLFHLHAEGL
jgi:1-deoxy-D-xylulose-5-phosphate synthase